MGPAEKLKLRKRLERELERARVVIREVFEEDARREALAACKELDFKQE
jgi:hypothetical protein